MSHDQLWKDVIWAFFQDFMGMFAPAAAREMDFSQARPLDKEVFTDLVGGKQRIPDLVVEVRTLDGEPEIVLVHVEVQRRRAADVSRRMAEYYALLRLRHRAPVYPMVLYLTAGAGGITRETYRESLFGEELATLSYLAIGLPDLAADAYIEMESPLGPAVASLMRSERYDAVTKTLRALERLAGSRIDEARKSLLARVVGAYSELSASEEHQLQVEVWRTGSSEVRNMVTIFEKWGIEQGIEQGIEKGIEQGIEKGIEKGVREGLLQGQRRALLSVLTKRFGQLPDRMVARVNALSDADALDGLTVRAVEAATLADLGL
jgi:hypothetical protein